MPRQLKACLDAETETFLGQLQFLDKAKMRQLLRNVLELLEQDQVQLPSIHAIVSSKMQHSELNDGLAVILFYLIRHDEFQTTYKKQDNKDQMHAQCLILFKNLKQTELLNNPETQIKILEHLRKIIGTTIHYYLKG